MCVLPSDRGQRPSGGVYDGTRRRPLVTFLNGMQIVPVGAPPGNHFTAPERHRDTRRHRHFFGKRLRFGA